MKTLIIFAHPNIHSFNAAIKDQVIKGLKRNRNEIRIHDLYQDNFDPLIKTHELSELDTTNPYNHLEKKYQDDLLWAKKIIIIHPCYWYGPPAILKGYFDRILSVNFAYRYEGDHHVPLLKGKKGILIQTFDAEEISEREDFEDITYKSVVFTWKYCGVSDWERLSLFRIIFSDRKQREKWLEEAYKIGASIK